MSGCERKTGHSNHVLGFLPMRLTFLRNTLLCLLALAVSGTAGQRSVVAAELFGLSPGTVELQSAGPMAFGPSGVLFVGDSKAAKVYAINTEDKKGNASVGYAIDDLSSKAAAALGGKVSVADLAVNPETGNAFLSVTVGGKAGLAKVTPDGKVTRLNLDKIGHAAVALPNPPEDKVVQRGRRSSNPREQSITDLAYTDGRVLVSGLSASESPSTVREFEFPFRESSAGMQVEIYHAAHGRSEDYAAIQTFIPFTVDGEPSVLAGFTCTPLVKIPVGNMKSNAKVTGTTVAELGNRNRPLDMIAYKQGGKDYLLLANSARGVMKVSTDDLAKNEGLTEPVRGGGTAGQPYETIESLVDIVQLDQLDETHALVIVQKDDGPMSLRSVELP
jgi:hypothetical protein